MIGGAGDSADISSRSASEDDGLVHPPLVRFAGFCSIVVAITAAILVYAGVDIATAVPAQFRMELLVVYGAATLCVLLSIGGLDSARYLAIGAFSVIVALLRITAGPGSLALVLTMIALVLSTVFVRSKTGRRTLMFAVVFGAGFLPTPEYVFGVASASNEPILRLVPVVLGMLAIVVVELAVRVVNGVYREKERNNRLEAGMQSLARANVGFQTYSKNVGERSKQDERNRITREVHDSVGYALTNISIMIDAATGLLDRDPERVRVLLRSGREQVDSAHWEVRRALHALRSLDNAETYGTKNVLRIAEQFQDATSVNVDIDLGNSRRSYGAHVDATLYRFVQEALANAFRHGRATQVEVRLWESETHISLSVRDNGIGTDSVEEGIGFVGIRERLSQVNGMLTWQSFDSGFVLRCEIPLEAVLRQ